MISNNILLQHEPPPTLVAEQPQQDNTQKSITNTSSTTDCTLAYIRALTAPPIHPPTLAELNNGEMLLLAPWNLRLPVDTSDAITRKYWSSQHHTKLFEQLFEWTTNVAKQNQKQQQQQQHQQAVKLQPFFKLSASPLLFTPPWKEIATCIQHLLFRRVGCRQTSAFMALTCFGQCLFLATGGPDYIEQEIWGMHMNRSYYLLRCHYDSDTRQLLFGYHRTMTTASSNETGGTAGKDPRKTFYPLVTLSLRTDVDWRLKTCQIMVNIARILNSLIDYGIPLTCQPEKRCIVVQDDDSGGYDYCIQKIYASDTIGGIPNATVDNMVDIYHTLMAHKVPHVDQLLKVERQQGRTKRGNDDNDTHTYSTKSCSTTTTTTTCCFGPIGRNYMPLNVEELLDALVCIAEALVAVHGLGLMHRDIRWANVFHAFQSSSSPYDDNYKKNPTAALLFSNEWILFDFEYAAISPQPSFGKYTLTSSNHAPEMFTTTVADIHTTAVDIWALGYLIQTANVDLPKSHAVDLERLRMNCMEEDAEQRPNATGCLETLRLLKARKRSNEKEGPNKPSSLLSARLLA
jgi:hypothetical protein